MYKEKKDFFVIEKEAIKRLMEHNASHKENETSYHFRTPLGTEGKEVIKRLNNYFTSLGVRVEVFVAKELVTIIFKI